jgi:hypothetical protein
MLKTISRLVVREYEKDQTICVLCQTGPMVIPFIYNSRGISQIVSIAGNHENPRAPAYLYYAVIRKVMRGGGGRLF